MAYGSFDFGAYESSFKLAEFKQHLQILGMID
jgi:hypothetical protein